MVPVVQDVLHKEKGERKERREGGEGGEEGKKRGRKIRAELTMPHTLWRILEES